MLVIITVRATIMALLLVPVMCSFFVLDLKWVKWQTIEKLDISGRQDINSVSI